MRFPLWHLLCGSAVLVGGFSASARAEDKVDFAKQIWPIFEAKCVSCHGPKKQKGKFRLDTPDALLKGAGGEKVIHPGNVEESTLFRLVALPKDDPDVMPPEDENKPLTKAEQDLVALWIKQNAPFGDWKGLESKEPEKVDLVTTLKAPAADEAALKKLQELGALAMPIAANTNLINVDFRGVAEQIGDSHLALLAPVAEQITWLNLAQTKISDGGLAQIKGLKNLTRLHLEKTAVGDGALAHLSGLQNLEYLNLYGTKVSDGGLDHLKGLKNLKKLFLWQTAVTDEGEKKITGALPGIDVNRGWKGPIPEPAAEKSDGKPSISDIMKKAHKEENLLKKVLEKQASDDEKKTLVSLYEALAAHPSPKGDANSWKEKTTKILELAKKATGGDEGALGGLKEAANCKACHSVHK